MSTLYITDLDGTLLNSDGVLSEYTKQKINEFSERGIHFSFATARSVMSAAPLLAGVKISAPAVLMNGVFVYDTNEKKAVSYNEIPPSNLKEIAEIFKAHGMHFFLFLYGDDGEMYMEYDELDGEGMEEFYRSRKEMLGNRFTRAEDITAVPDGRHAVYISRWAPHSELLPVTEKLKKVRGVSFAFYADTYSDDWLLEIFSEKSSKASSAEEVKKIINADSITAFGDNYNDILMLKRADRAVAVRNAVQELKDLADFVIGTNDEDSVVKFIESENK